MPAPLLYESHMHTPLCKHACGSPSEYAAVAHRRNLKGIIVTCHNPMPDGYSAGARMCEAQWPEYCALIAKARAEWAGRVEILMGLECDYAPGFEAFLEKQIAGSQLHHVLGSVHPQVGEYRSKYFTGDPVAYQRVYFEHLAMAAESKLFDTLSHPDLVKVMDVPNWDVQRIIDDIRRALDRIARTGVAMELNTSGKQKALPEFNPGPEILREMALRKIPVVLGADAHVPERVAADYEEALDALTAAGHAHVHIVTNRQRTAIPIPAARASLTPL